MAPITTNRPLYFHTHNPDRHSSILFIHGALSTLHEFDQVAAHISAYHLLIPNLLAYDDGATARPLTLDGTTDLLASLVRDHARNAKAHIVGASLGHYFALRLAALYPHLVDSVFITGAGTAPTSSLKPILPYAICAINALESCIPNAWRTRWMDGADMSRAQAAPTTVASASDFVSVWTENEDPVPIRVRTLICAATKRSFMLPTNDNVDYARKLCDTISKPPYGCVESRIVGIPTMRHPWWLQDPCLFAKSVCAWIERAEFPAELITMK